MPPPEGRGMLCRAARRMEGQEDRMEDSMRCLGGRVALLIASAGVGACLLLAGHLSAQTAPPGGAAGFAGSSALPDDEVTPRLVLGPKDEVLRLWQRRGDERGGGGA